MKYAWAAWCVFMIGLLVLSAGVSTRLLRTEWLTIDMLWR